MGGNWLGPNTDCGPPNPCERPPPPDPCAVKFVSCDEAGDVYMDCDDWEAMGSPSFIKYQGGCYQQAGFVVLQVPPITATQVTSCDDPECNGICGTCPPCPDCVAVSWGAFFCPHPPNQCYDDFDGGTVTCCRCYAAGIGVITGRTICPPPTGILQTFPVTVTAELDCGPCPQNFDCNQSPGPIPGQVCWICVLTFAFGAGQGHAATYIRNSGSGDCPMGGYIRCNSDLGEDLCTPMSVTVS